MPPTFFIPRNREGGIDRLIRKLFYEADKYLLTYATLIYRDVLYYKKMAGQWILG